MIILLASVFLVINQNFVFTKKLDGDGDLYPYAIQALKELQHRQLMDEKHYAPNVIQRASSVCYDELGCFDKNGTFKHLKQLPEPPETVNTQFLLYTRKNPETPQFLDYRKPETILNSNINKNLPLKFISHGFGGRQNLTWIWEMKNAFLKKEDVNVIAIDWSLGARTPYYIQAAVNSELVGAQAAVLYYLIKDTFGIMEKDLHCVGFSLGAHVVGFIGKRMMEARGTRPGRITALDAASPLFEDYGEDVHLYKEDADFVDVIHTNADLVIYGGVGILKPIGHVDYYPNGGKRQPGCGSTLKGLVIDMINGDGERKCNHERAVHLFTDSILERTPCKYTSYHCDNYEDFQMGKCFNCDKGCGQMGYNTKGTGIFFLMTASTKPYCTDIAQLTVRFSKGIKKSYGALTLTLIGGNGVKENVTLTEEDDKLSPGGQITFTVPVSDALKPLHAIDALYKRFGGWFYKGTETFSLASITMKDAQGNYIFKSCGKDVILKDGEYQLLFQTDGVC